MEELASVFPLPWSSYVRLLSVKSDYARAFYETEALRGGWKAAMLQWGAKPKPEDTVSPEEALKDPYVLEFLGLKDEYSESDLKEALIRHLEYFLLELGGDFTFVARQKRIRIGDDEWYRVDLVFFHRRLRCADAGQMHLYFSYARENWTLDDENSPVGLILCSQKNTAVVKYALEGLPNKVMAAEYKTALPDERLIAAELERTRRVLDERRQLSQSSEANEKGGKRMPKRSGI